MDGCKEVIDERLLIETPVAPQNVELNVGIIYESVIYQAIYTNETCLLSLD